MSPTPSTSAALTPSASATIPRTTDVEGSIVFQRGGDLWVVDQRGERALMTTPWIETRPAWSDDGTTVVFASNKDGQIDLYTMKADGSNLTRLTQTPADEGAAGWSPDGKRIAFVTFADPGGGTVWVMNADGTNATEIYKDANAFIGFDEWSPNDRLLLSVDKAGGGELDLYSIDPDGTDISAVVQNRGDDSGGRYSNDGSKLAFWSDGGPAGGEPGIYIMSKDGSVLKIFADPFAIDTVALAWSSDEREIAWTGKFEGGAGSPIFVMSADGGNLRQLTEALPEASGIDWR
jgi:TolB protein